MGPAPLVCVSLHEPWPAPGVLPPPTHLLPRSLGCKAPGALPFLPQNDLPAGTPASKSCDSSPPQDASTPGPSSTSHLRQLAAKPAPSTDSIGEHLLVPARTGLLSGEFQKMVGGGGGRTCGFQA